MARIRSIKPEFFMHERLAELSPLHRLLFIGLWTLADRRGRLEDRPKRIRASVLPYDDGNVEQMLTDLFDAGFIVRYEAKGERYISIPAFEKHQRVSGKEAQKDSEIPPPPGKRAGSTRGSNAEHTGEASGKHPGALEYGVRSTEYGVQELEAYPAQAPATDQPQDPRPAPPPQPAAPVELTPEQQAHERTRASYGSADDILGAAHRAAEQIARIGQVERPELELVGDQVPKTRKPSWQQELWRDMRDAREGLRAGEDCVRIPDAGLPAAELNTRLKRAADQHGREWLMPAWECWVQDDANAGLDPPFALQVFLSDKALNRYVAQAKRERQEAEPPRGSPG